MVITENGGPYADYVEKPDNYGIAAFAMIETSHCALHVWDRVSPPLAQLDVYSCSDFDPAVVVRMLDAAMGITKVDCGLVNRADQFEMLTMIPDDWYKIKTA
jgi:S-adenosylmethionine/arginine decarboxylase-like enzyme